jgi:cbb3-type cytochrome oxidase subunit 3
LILFTCLISTVGLILLLFLCIVCFALQKSRPESYMELNQVEEDEN